MKGSLSMKPQVFTNDTKGCLNKKTKSVLLKVSTELIGIYLWFLQFSNFLLKLVQ